jgi:hypothetical protein
VDHGAFDRPRSGRDPRAALLAIVATFSAAYAIARAHGAAPGGSAYETSFTAVMFHNLMTYTSWVASMHRALPDLARSYDAHAWHIGLPVLGVTIAAAIGSRRESAAIRFGLLWWIAGLLPVLPLRYSAYPHYLYVALPGLALAIAATLVAALNFADGRMRRDTTAPADSGAAADGASSPLASIAPRPRWIAVATIATVYTLVSMSHVSQRLELRMQSIDLPRDPQVRSFVVAGRAVYSLARYDMTHVSRLAIIAAPEQMRVFGARSGREYGVSPAARGYDLMRVVLDDGRALRVFFPVLDSVVYTNRWSPSLARFDLAIPGEAGSLVLLGRGLGAVRALADTLEAGGAPRAAAELRDSLRTADPAVFTGMQDLDAKVSK